MKIKTFTVALCLTLAPTLSFAMGCNGAKHEQAQSCAAGTTYDADSQSCVKLSA